MARRWFARKAHRGGLLHRVSVLTFRSPARPGHAPTPHSERKRTMKMRHLLAIAATGFSLVATCASAQIPQYGRNITLDEARKVVAAAIADAKTRGWPMAVAVVDTAGILVAFEKMDNTQN